MKTNIHYYSFYSSCIYFSQVRANGALINGYLKAECKKDASGNSYVKKLSRVFLRES
jgi:hypothetical protein